MPSFHHRRNNFKAKLRHIKFHYTFYDFVCNFVRRFVFCRKEKEKKIKKIMTTATQDEAQIIAQKQISRSRPFSHIATLAVSCDISDHWKCELSSLPSSPSIHPHSPRCPLAIHPMKNDLLKHSRFHARSNHDTIPITAIYFPRLTLRKKSRRNLFIIFHEQSFS